MSKYDKRKAEDILITLLNICEKTVSFEKDIIYELLKKIDEPSIEIIKTSVTRNTILFKEFKKNIPNVDDSIIIILITIGYIESLKDIRVLKFFLSAWNVEIFDLKTLKNILEQYHLPPKKLLRFYYITYEKQINEYNRKK